MKKIKMKKDKIYGYKGEYKGIIFYVYKCDDYDSSWNSRRQNRDWGFRIEGEKGIRGANTKKMAINMALDIIDKI